MPRVAVILSGCGYLDGAEIHETTLSLLYLEQKGADWEGLAPDKMQRDTANHLTGEASSASSRNVLHEAARITRGNIKDIQLANPEEYDAAIFPGGFGVAKNLSNYIDGEAAWEVDTGVKAFASAMHQAKKPLGFMCISPVLVPAVCVPGCRVTLGAEGEVGMRLQNAGCEYVPCPVTDIVADEERNVVSTPAYMEGESIGLIAMGIERLIEKVLAWC